MSSLLVKAFIYNNKNNNKLYYSDVYKLPLGLMYKNEKKPPPKNWKQNRGPWIYQTMSDTYSQGDIFKWVKTFDNKGICMFLGIVDWGRFKIMSQKKFHWTPIILKIIRCTLIWINFRVSRKTTISANLSFLIIFIIDRS